MRMLDLLLQGLAQAKIDKHADVMFLTFAQRMANAGW